MGDGSTSGSRATEGLGTSLANSMRDVYNAGPKVYGQSLYTGLGSNTQGGLQDLHTAANAGAGGLNSAYDWAQGVVGSGGYNPALSSAQGGIEQYLAESQQDAPGYARVRQDVADDTLGGVNASFLTDGRFGSSVHTDQATRSLGGVLANMDMTNNENRLNRMLGGNQALAGIGQTAMGNAGAAASAVPGLYGATLAPAQTRLQIGQMQDADAQAARLADYDLWDRTANAQTGLNAQTISMLSQLQSQPGTQEETPWWQTAAGLGIAGLGALF